MFIKAFLIFHVNVDSDTNIYKKIFATRAINEMRNIWSPKVKWLEYSQWTRWLDVLSPSRGEPFSFSNPSTISPYIPAWIQT